MMYVKFLSHFTVYLIFLGAGRCHKTDRELNFDYFILIYIDGFILDDKQCIMFYI